MICAGEVKGSRFKKDRRMKPGPNLQDFVMKGCSRFTSPETAEEMINTFFDTGRKPCEICGVKCGAFVPRSGTDRRKH